MRHWIVVVTLGVSIVGCFSGTVGRPLGGSDDAGGGGSPRPADAASNPNDTGPAGDREAPAEDRDRASDGDRIVSDDDVTGGDLGPSAGDADARGGDLDPSSGDAGVQGGDRESRAGDTGLAAGGCFATGERPPSVEPAGFAIPSLEDERRAYRAWGWTWSTAAEPNFASDPGYYVQDPDIHGDTEGDDLWSYLMAYLRTGEGGYLHRATAWARYFEEDYRACAGDPSANFCYDRDAFGADHLWGWGLLSWGLARGAPSALAEAEALAEVLHGLYQPDSPFGCLPSSACIHYGVRQVGRHLLLATRVAEVTGAARWIALRDKIADLVLSSPHWNETYGIYFYGDWQTDSIMGNGAYASGARITSPFQIGVLTEALDHLYRVTGREEARRRMVAMARFVDQYGLDATYRYTGSSFGIVGGAPYHNYSARPPVTFWDPVYTTSLVNTLMRGFRYTCEPRFYEQARTFFERGTKGVYGSPTARRAPDGVVEHFVDTRFASSAESFYLDFNKGELQYTYLLFAPVE